MQGQGLVSARTLARRFKWYHIAYGATLAGAMNVGIFGGILMGYRWYYRDELEELRAFERRFGRPTERQRLDVYSWLAPTYDKKIGSQEKAGAIGYRKEIFAGVSGDVLEVAVGTGRCFEAIQGASQDIRRYVGIDRTQEMLDVAKPKAAELPFPTELLCGDAHRLPFPDASFDTVLGSLCLCAMEQPEVVLDEMARVCRPGGRVLLLEVGVARRWLPRLVQRKFGLVPNPRIPWELGWFDDLDVLNVVRASERLTVWSVWTRAMGNWYLITMSRRVDEAEPQAATKAAAVPSPEAAKVAAPGSAA